ncbi:hypothetical protein [uncultured Alistipes sp.]|uniref:hypothetical protein n=1 Tax=uncultured Alistipes sp. TaxID=538949 RepID=UPI002620CB57|nr:hypothetical protein [uncultured Alistipes sp.]
MKKLLIGIALLLSVGTEGFCNGSITDDPTLSSTQIKIAVTGGRPRPRPRGEDRDAIEVTVDKNIGLLYALFDESFGVVSISVKNSMGITVASTQCDTSIESGAVLSVPTTADSYTLTIVGNDLEMVGYYDLE